MHNVPAGWTIASGADDSAAEREGSVRCRREGGEGGVRGVDAPAAGREREEKESDSVYSCVCVRAMENERNESVCVQGEIEKVSVFRERKR